MHSLIIGSTSIIGAAIATELASLGPVATAGRRDADFLVDLADPYAKLSVGRPFDAVIYVAADFGGRSDADFIRAEEVNAVGVLRGCAIAKAAGAKHFVLISSVSAQYRSGDPYFGIYALSKRHGEEVTELFCAQNKMTLTIVRPTAVYDAAGGCRAHQGLLYGMIDRAIAGDDITLYGSTDPERSYLYISDLASAVKGVVETTLAGTFVCASPQRLRISELARLALQTFGSAGRVHFDPSKSDIPDLGQIVGVDLFEQLGDAPRIDMAEGLRLVREAFLGLQDSQGTETA
jgi:nucleoside-diphosphate-sugar epimerase